MENLYFLPDKFDMTFAKMFELLYRTCVDERLVRFLPESNIIQYYFQSQNHNPVNLYN